MTMEKMLTRKKTAAFGMGFFGMFWIGGTCGLALYELGHRMIYGRFPDMDMGALLGQGAFIFAHTPGEPALLRALAARLIETDVIVAVMTVPFLFLVFCVALYGRSALIGDIAGLRLAAPARAGDSGSQRKRDAAFSAKKPSQAPPHPSYRRPVPPGGEKTGKQAA